MRIRLATTFTLAALLLAGLGGCREEGPAEKFGRKVDEATERASGAMERAKDHASDAMDRAAERAKDKLDGS